MPVVDAVVDVLPKPFVFRGSTGTSDEGRDATDFSASENADCLGGLFGLLTLDLLCTPSRRSSDEAESDAEPPMLNRRCQLPRRACPFLSGDWLASGTGVWVDDVRVPVLTAPMSTFTTLLERLRRPLALVVFCCELLLYSTLSDTGGSTAPCPCVSGLVAELAEEGPRGTKGAAADCELEEELRVGEGVSRRGLLRERARRSAELVDVWVGGSTNMVWLALSDRYFGPKGEHSADGTMHGDGVLAREGACRCSGSPKDGVGVSLLCGFVSRAGGTTGHLGRRGLRLQRSSLVQAGQLVRRFHA